MTSYWSRVEPFWNDCPTDDLAAYIAFYRSMPAVARDLLTTHWVVSEVCNGGFHQLFTNPTGVLVPEAVTGFRSMQTSPEGQAFYHSGLLILRHPPPIGIHAHRTA